MDEKKKVQSLNDLDDASLATAIENRWRDSDALWGKMKELGTRNRNYWKNEWEERDKSARKTSRTKDNRIFLAMEHDVNILSARPAKPIVLPADENNDDSRSVASSLQDIFLDLYRKRQVKKKLKRGIRNLHWDRIIVLYPFWDTELNDVNVRKVDPKNVRIPKNANNEDDAEWLCEEVTEPILKMLGRFPEDREKILKEYNISEKDSVEKNVDVKYKMFWTNDFVAYKIKNNVFKKKKNPTWDWEGLVIAPQEEILLKQLHGMQRRGKMDEIKQDQAQRVQTQTNQDTGEIEPVLGEDGSPTKNQATYFYNYFDKPRKPYIFGTILEDEDGPFGSTDLITQSGPLQDNVNRRKRQFDDNAEDAGGIFLFDKRTFDRADVQKFSGRAGTRLFGKDILNGFKRDTGRELPTFMFNDMTHSISEIDNIWATQGIVRGERQGEETASGRAMLREAALERRDEAIDLIDFVTCELYKWWFQLMKLNYTEYHYVKAMGIGNTLKTIELMQDDLEDGIDIKVLPGQVVPDDKLYREERAKEELSEEVITPLDYYRAVGKDNPEELFKRLIMFKINPMSLVTMTPEEQGKLMTGQNKSAGDVSQQGDMEQIKAYLQSEEFQALPDDQKKVVMEQIKQKVGTIQQ